jgi:RNA polymerase sigma-70 factor (ECF subfamily)
MNSLFEAMPPVAPGSLERLGPPTAAEFEAVMRAHNRLLFRLARSIIRNDSLAEDVVQSAYLAAYSKLNTVSDPTKLRSWLARITVNEAIDFTRREKRSAALPEGWQEEAASAAAVHHGFASSETPEASAARGELRQVLEDAIDQLPPVLRSVLVLRDVEGLSASEVAACLGLGEVAVRVRLFRARARMRKWLGDRFEASKHAAFEFAGERCDRIVARTLARWHAEETSVRS